MSEHKNWCDSLNDGYGINPCTCGAQHPAPGPAQGVGNRHELNAWLGFIAAGLHQRFPDRVDADFTAAMVGIASAAPTLPAGEAVAWSADWIRDRIADQIETWPHNEMWPPQIAEFVRAIKITPPQHPEADSKTVPKDHEIRNAVTDLCAVAVQFHSAQQLRARLQGVLFPLLGKFGWQIPAYRTEADSRTAAEMCHRSGVDGGENASQQECIPAPGVQQAVAVKRWPFVESPGDFTERFRRALDIFPTYLAALRNVLIENPPTLSAEYLALAHPAPAEPPGREGLDLATIDKLRYEAGLTVGPSASLPVAERFTRAIERAHGIAPPTERGTAAHQPKEGDQP